MLPSSKQLIEASKNGDVFSVERILQNAIYETCEERAKSLALYEAAKIGHLEIVQHLIAVCDPKDNGSIALTVAAEKGHLNVVEVLAPLSDPKAHYSRALLAAVIKKNLDVVKFLIPVSDPKADRSSVLKLAIKGGQQNLIDLLIPLCNTEQVFLDLIDKLHHLEADRLSEHVSIETLRRVDNLVSQQMPKARSLLLKETLEHHLSPTQSSNERWEPRRCRM